MAGWATKIEGNTIPHLRSVHAGSEVSRLHAPRARSESQHKSSPGTFQLLMAAWKLGPALAAGCTVVLKPAEQTPLSALRLRRTHHGGWIPRGRRKHCPGLWRNGRRAALAAHPDVDKVAFTGSTEVGKLIVHAAAGNLKKVSLRTGVASLPTSCSRTPISRLPSQVPRARFSSITANAAAPGRVSMSRSRSSTASSKASPTMPGKSTSDQVSIRRPAWDRSSLRNN